MSFDLDKIFDKVKNTLPFDENELIQLFIKLSEVLYAEDNLLRLKSPITICGDIHGQLFDLFQLFETAGDPDTKSYLFMGDYVDRGYYSLHTFVYLCALKLKRPTGIYLLRGNHESRQVNQMYGFYAEILLQFGHPGIWTFCNDIFDLLPMAAIIDEQIFSVHGGLSPDISTIDKISLINRNEELGQKGPFCDMCWSDPEEVSEWKFNPRCAGYLFGENQSKEFCRINKLRFVTRSHQLAQEGYQWFFDKTVITVWSAPNYMYRCGNLASVMEVSADHAPDGFKLIVFDKCPEDKARVPDEIPNNYYFL